ncbi:MAG TPA: hypothetical protein PKY59_15095 [Pyrinomonadaceae bacterium]|nr:hypothetical protein [Pyrinomonadaceae bacterium]
MKKSLLLLFFSLCFFVSFSNAQSPSPTINLSKEKVDPGSYSRGCPAFSEENYKNEMLVAVSIEGVSAKLKDDEYKYTVSGGKLIGKGKNVQWDFYNVRPGTYTINLEVVENRVKKTASKSINVYNGLICDCECPTLSVTSSATEIKRGETIRFQLNIAGGTQDEVKIKWTISGGKILEGQGTYEIVVEANTGNEKELTATAEVSGLCLNCPDNDSSGVKIIDK